MTLGKRKKKVIMVNKNKICKASGCSFHASSKGYCINHYHKYQYWVKKNEGKQQRDIKKSEESINE